MKISKGKIVKGISATFAGAAVIAASPLLACGSDPYIGSVCITAATYCPSQTHIEANGQILAISNYQALFSLLGTTYGGNGTSNFALPDMRGRTPVGAGTGTGLNTVLLGAMRGFENMTLHIQHMPSHTHSAVFTPDGSSASASVQASTKQAVKPQAAEGDYIASNNPLGGAPKFIAEADAGSTVALGGVSGGGGGGTVQVDVTGGGQAFPNYSPQLGLKYCIAFSGIYPTRQ